jgi:hypothetical protein
MKNSQSQANSLPQPAKRLVLWLSVAAAMVLASVLASAGLEGRGGDALTLGVWIAAAALAGTVKFRFPGFESSYSFGFIAVLAAISMLPLPDAILVSLITALVQCYWRARKRPLPVQILFNLSNYAVSAAAAWYAFHGLERLAPNATMAACFTFGAGVFFLINSGLVSWILAILSERGFMDVWESSHLLMFPCYLVGAAVAAALAWQNTWITLLAVLPLLGLLDRFVRAWLRKAAASGTPAG